MSTATLSIAAARSNSFARTLQIYFTEARFEFVRLLRTRAFSLAVIGFPVIFYLFFGLMMTRGEHLSGVSVAKYMLGSYAVFGMVGAALFGIGGGLASELSTGWLELKRASPMPSLAYVVAKCCSAAAFGLIDNDIPGTDYSIGFDTAVNTALEAIDRIRDTAFAYERVFCVEVMGRDSGFIAIAVALGGGAEAVIVPEIPFSLDDICDRVEDSHRRGKRSTIVVVSEGPRTGGVIPVAEALTARLGMQARVVVLGHVQRGGAPTARDRLLASRMGAGAIKAILDGAGPSLIGEDRGAIVRVPLSEVATQRRPLDPSLIELVHQLST